MLKLDNVTYRYKKASRDAVKEATATFESGRVSVIMGPSGSGKTTLLSILAGLDRPSSGEVIIGEEKLAHMNLDKYRREKISMVFQAFHLFPLYTALENVSYLMETGGKPRSEARAKAKELLETVGINDGMYMRYPSKLSGGEQQRVAIARSLSTGAKVILADEPTGNLDRENGEVIINLLRMLANKEGYCVVIVTHNHEIAALGDRMYKMNDGVLTEQK
jgi:putative ABC transport system ATP-binding protein